jgi:FMN phosphatase YigB (HAD superfamily)
VAFLFQCANQKIKLILLTRHTAEVQQTLLQYRLSGIFDAIIQVPPRPACKSQFIKESKSILIDDSFSERCDAASKLGIPTFDCSMLEMLIDDRV